MPPARGWAHPPAVAIAGFVSARACRNSDTANELGIKDGDVHDALASDGPGAVAFQESQSGFRDSDTHATLDSNNGSRRHQRAMTQSGVRRLTPVECERLQGFPDGFTEPLSDSARYRVLGNAVSVPVAFWIGKRLLEVHDER